MKDQSQTAWIDSIDLSFPCWEDYLPAIERLIQASIGSSDLPTPDDLQLLLPATACNHKQAPIRFVSADSIAGVAYEEHIYETGQISTRNNSWHDLLNALVWSRFPHLKAAMNTQHYREIQKQKGTVRGRLRDALTLWDESGVIIASSDPGVLDALAQRNWNHVFRDCVSTWDEDTQVFVCGHALLEKFLNPYKAITAHALLVQTAEKPLKSNRLELLLALDRNLASNLQGGQLIKSTRDLSPIPLAGIPGWWMDGEQGDDFYKDSRVFRHPPENFVAAPILQAGPEMTYQAIP